MDPFPFVVCSPRSGSTLLRAMLNAHPRLAIPPESHFLTMLYARRRSFMDGDRPAFDRLLEALADDPRFERWGLGPDDVRAAEEDRPASLPDAIRSLYRAYARKHGKDRYGDKTPGYALHLSVLSEWLPESVFVHLIRDGRDVAASLREAPFGPTRPEDCARYWMERVRAAVQAGTRLGGRYLEIRYEDLVKAPEPELRAVCALAGLDFDSSMLDHRQGVSAIIRSTVAPQIHGKLRRRLHMARDWRRELTKAEARRFEAVAGDVLASLGYPVSDA